MKKKYVFNILLVSVIVFFAAGYYAYNAFNRKNESLTKIESAYKTSSQLLLDAFSKNVNSANQKYIDKVIEVEGPVKRIESSDKGMATIVMGEENSMSSLRFSIDSTETEKAKHIAVNSTIRIKGMCTGYNADELGLGSDLLFNRAIIIETIK